MKSVLVSMIRKKNHVGGDNSKTLIMVGITRSEPCCGACSFFEFEICFHACSFYTIPPNQVEGSAWCFGDSGLLAPQTELYTFSATNTLWAHRF